MDFDKFDDVLALKAGELGGDKKDKWSFTTKKKKLFKKVKKEKFTPPPWPLLQETVIFSFDTEWQDHRDGSDNEVLCYSIAIKNKDQMFSSVYHVGDHTSKRKVKKRLSVSQLVQKGIEDAIEAGVLDTCPEHMFMCAHFLKADIFHFDRAFEGVGAYLQGMRNTVTGAKDAYAVDFDELKRKRIDKEPLAININRNKKRVYIRFYDTMLLAPNGKDLKSVGELLGLTKLPLPNDCDYTDMKDFRKRYPQKFDEYAIRDAEISAKHLASMIDFCVNNGLTRLPTSIGSLAMSLYRKQLPEGFDIKSAFGNYTESTLKRSQARGKYFTRKVTKPVLRRQLHEQFAIMSYHGGRNEAFYMGVTPVGKYYDIDIASCYTAIMLGLREVDFNNGVESKEVDDFFGDVCSFAYVEFEFPKHVKYPCLPVRMGDSLVFPMSGESLCTGHEIEVAAGLGVNIKSIEGRVYPWKNDVPLFKDFMTWVRKMRKSHPKKSFTELMYKEVGNSLYGKVCQGLNGQMTFDIDNGLSKKLPYTAITNPYFASYVTGFARAFLGEMLNSLPENRQAYSVTTDGFITDAPINEISQEGTMYKRFTKLFRQIDSGDVLEVKHRVKQFICARTRIQMTTIPMEDSEVICAKPTVRVPDGVSNHNDYFIELYMTRTPDTKVDASHLTSVRDMYTGRRGMKMENKEQRFSAEFDFKRRPVNSMMVSVLDDQHVGAFTVPYQHVDEIVETRAYFTGFRTNNCLKNVDDVELFEDYLAMQKAKKGKGMNLNDGDTPDIFFVRAFLRLYKNSMHKVGSEVMKPKELSELLATRGYDYPVTTINQNKGRKVILDAVPRRPSSLACFEWLSEIFPDEDLAVLFAD